MSAPRSTSRPRLAGLRDRYAEIRRTLSIALQQEQTLDKLDAAELSRAVDHELAAVITATDELRALAADLRRVTPSEELDSWAAERDELAQLFATAARAATLRWLHHVLSALADFDLDTLDEIASMELPTAARVLAERVRLLRADLASRVYDADQPLLALAVEEPLALAVGLTKEKRARLALILARLSVAADQETAAERWLDRAAELGARDSDVSLVRAWLARELGDYGRARELLERARAADPDGSGALLEQAHQLAAEPSAADTLDTVIELGIWSLPTIEGAERTLAWSIEPVPAEVWMGLARRWLAEQDPIRAQAAVLQAQRVAGARPSLLADIGELRIACLESMADPELLYGARVETATHLLDLGRVDRALELLDQALHAKPDAADALLLEADGLRLRAANLSLAQATPDLERTLAIVEQVPVIEGNADRSWSFLLSSLAEFQLSTGLDEQMWDRTWRGLSAAAWSVAFVPTSTWRWNQLTTAAFTVGLYRLSRRAAEIGRLVARSDDDRTYIGDSLMVALANTDDLDKAYEETATDPDLFLHHVLGAVRGHAAPLVDHIVGSNNLETMPPYAWSWLLTGLRATEDPRSTTIADLAIKRSGRESDDWSWVEVEIDAMLVQGRAGEAAELAGTVLPLLARRSPRRQQSYLYPSMAVLVGGDRAEGLRLVAESLTVMPTLAMRKQWPNIDRPALLAFAAAAGRKLSEEELGELDRCVAERLDVLAERDVETELVEFELDGPDRLEADRAREVVRAVLRLAAGDASGVVALGRAQYGENDQRATHLERRAVEGAAALRTATLVSRLSESDPAQVPAIVAELLDRGTSEAAIRLANTALSPAVRAAVAESLSGVAAVEGPRRENAVRLLSDLGWPEAPPPVIQPTRGWELELPSSWFAGIEDPLREHPIFLQTIPAVRKLSDGLPPVHVTASDELEPDGYVVGFDGSVSERGTAAISVRWAPDSRDLVPDWPPITGGAEGSGWLAVQPANDPLGMLATVSTEEMVVRRVAELAVRSAAPAEPIPEEQPVRPLARRVVELASALIGGLNQWVQRSWRPG
jgi:tetratricopeptide (TPR) repeat protein